MTVQAYAHIRYSCGKYTTNMETIDPNSNWKFRVGSLSPNNKPMSYFVENPNIKVTNDAGTTDAATHYPKSYTNVVLELKSDGKVKQIARNNIAPNPLCCTIL